MSVPVHAMHLSCLNVARDAVLASTFVTLCLVPGAPVPAATTYEVRVEDSPPVVYYPNDISITVGDTVRWINGPGGSFHDVTAANGSWASPVAREFVYERTFNTAGDFRYYCNYHDPNDDDGTHHGIVRVTPEAVTQEINAGLSDAWYHPALAGQGFFITVWEQTQLVFLSWFTYDTTFPPGNATAVVGDPGHRWLTAQGPYNGDTATLTVNETAGGIFGASQPQPATQAVGSIEITWADCNEALLTYDLQAYGADGQIALERIVPDGVALCEELSDE